MSLNKIKVAGFSLLEMLIAISIFSLIGLASNYVLSTVLKSEETTKDFAIRLKSLQQGFGALERDLGQMVARTPRSLEDSRGSTVLQTGDNLLGSESQALVFYRLGWLNPQGLLPRGSIQSVAYLVLEGKLERWHYPYPDPELGAEPVKSVVIDKVLSVEFSFFVEEKWVKKFDGKTLPKAIAMEIEVEGLGKIQRRFLLPESQSVSSSESGSGNNGNNGQGNSGNGQGNSGNGQGNTGSGKGNNRGGSNNDSGG